jgi:hypothetical protein
MNSIHLFFLQFTIPAQKPKRVLCLFIVVVGALCVMLVKADMCVAVVYKS